MGKSVLFLALIAVLSSAGAAVAQVGEADALELPVDESIKISVDPVEISNVVDRVMGPAVVTVKCPQATDVRLFLVPVNAPYGGRTLDKPRLIGSDSKPSDGLTVRWNSKESHQYVKLFAVVHKKNAPQVEVRSRTVDFAVGGSRYVPKPVKEGEGN
jgi:hypothetical protein